LTPPDDRRDGDAVAKPKPKRVQGAGSVDKLPSGRHRVRFTLKGKSISRVVDTEEEAEALRRELVRERAAQEREASLETEPEVETLATWGARWLQRREATGAVRWSKDDWRRWKKHVEGSPLAAMPLADVRPRDVRAWLNEMMAKRKEGGALLSRQTITHAYNLVRKALGDAAADEVIPSNPAAEVKVPKRAEKRDADPWTFLTADEIRKVETSEAIPEHLRLLFVVLIHTGLRAGEAWAARWSAVELDASPPCVVVRASHGSAPKNNRVQRVPLLPKAREAFTRLRELAGDPSPDDLVFPAPEGGQRHRNDDAGWSSRKRRGVFTVGWREKAGITRRARLHDCRHTFATGLVTGAFLEGKPLPLAEVRVLMRHGSIAMTERYAHLAPDHINARIAGPTTPAVAPRTVAVPYDAPPSSPDADDLPSAESSPSGVTPVTTPPPVGNVTAGQGPCETTVISARPEGLEPPTRGLEGRVKTAVLQGVFASHDRPVTDSPAGALSDVALDLLRAVDDGRPAGPIARGLALEVLRRSAPDSAPWLRAVDVLEAGALRVRVAVDLAGLLLDAAEQAVDQDRGEVA